MKEKLLVVSGLSGSGKDSVIEELLKRNSSFRRLITCADRAPRPGETHGVHYYFVTPEELDRMHANGELVEKPLLYGTSRKATPKAEFKKIVSGQTSLIWRIESSLAAHVASGKFFEEQFSTQEGSVLKESTTVVFITAKREVILARRKKRDGEKFDLEDFNKRDRQDQLILEKYGHLFKHIIENREGELGNAVDQILKLIAIPTS